MGKVSHSGFRHTFMLSCLSLLKHYGLSFQFYKFTDNFLLKNKIVTSLLDTILINQKVSSIKFNNMFYAILICFLSLICLFVY